MVLFFKTKSLFHINYFLLFISSVTAGNNYSKEKQFRSLNKIKNNRRVKVIRGGDIVEVSIFDILVGDVVSLDTGDQIPADGLYISGHGLIIILINQTLLFFLNKKYSYRIKS